MGRVDGKVAIVTGAAGGIGSATAATLAREGAAVVVADIAREGGRQVADKILAAGGRATYAFLDVTDPTSFREVAMQAVDSYGQIDILHNNAAGTHLYAQDTDLGSMDPADWDEIMTLNAKSVLLGCQAVLPIMEKQGSGAIINMSSTRAALGAMDLAAYGASKAAVDSFTRYVATKSGKRGVRCNSIQPGFIETAQSKALHAKEDGLSALMRHVSLPEPGSPDDIASLVLFLGSDEARYITGQMIRVDGGMLSHQPFVGDSM